PAHRHAHAFLSRERLHLQRPLRLDRRGRSRMRARGWALNKRGDLRRYFPLTPTPPLSTRGGRMLNLATLLRESAKADPGKPALVINDTTVSYGELHTFAQRLGGSLQSLGVTKGKHVALLLPNVPHFTIAYFATHYAGGAVVPLNVLLTADEIAYHLEDSDAVALVAWEGFLEQAAAAFERVPTCKHLIVAKADRTDLGAPEGAHNMTALIGMGAPLHDLPETMPDDTAVILYTSGTTGHPKGAELTHFNMFFNALYVRRFLIPMSGDTVALGTLPLFHSFGQTAIQNAVI